MNLFGDKVRNRRLELGFSLRRLANDSGLDYTYLSKIERGINPPPSEEAIKRLADSLYIDRDELLSSAGKVATEIIDFLLDNSDEIKRLRQFVKPS
jgi:transcriptional regulator with XRE-family HTH domain